MHVKIAEIGVTVRTVICRILSLITWEKGADCPLLDCSEQDRAKSGTAIANI